MDVDVPNVGEVLPKIEVIGFDGAPTAACGWALPLVCRTRGIEGTCVQEYFLLPVVRVSSFGNALEGISDLDSYVPDRIYTQSQIERDYETGRRTRLLKPLPARANMLILYVKKELLDAADIEIPKAWAESRDYFQLLDDDCCVVYLERDQITQLMRQFVDALLIKASNLLAEFHMLSSAEEQLNHTLRVEHITEMALDADYTEAYRSHIRLCQALAIMYSPTRARLQILWDLFLEQEFNGTYDDYFEQIIKQDKLVKSLARMKGYQPAEIERPVVSSQLIDAVQSSVSSRIDPTTARIVLPVEESGQERLPSPPLVTAQELTDQEQRDAALHMIVANLRARGPQFQMDIDPELAKALPSPLAAAMRAASRTQKRPVLNILKFLHDAQATTAVGHECYQTLKQAASANRPYAQTA